MIRASYVGKQAELEKIVGQTIDPIYFKCMPQGSKIHVIQEKVPESYGRIITTESYQESAQRQMGVGYVISAGPIAGKEQPGPVQGLLCEDPSDLIYKHIIYGANVGIPLRMSIRHNEFDAEVYAMDCKNVLSILDDPTPLKVRAEQVDFETETLGLIT